VDVGTEVGVEVGVRLEDGVWDDGGVVVSVIVGGIGDEVEVGGREVVVVQEDNPQVMSTTATRNAKIFMICSLRAEMYLCLIVPPVFEDVSILQPQERLIYKINGG
jgi:hypothetical protein